jgi:hypothetical protein
MTSDFDPDQPVSWRAVPGDVPVRSADGIDVGTVYDVMASSEEDIFHGLVVRLAGEQRDVFVSADTVTLLAASHVELNLTAADVRALPEHRDEHVFHLGWTGLRKHVGWVEEKDR